MTLSGQFGVGAAIESLSGQDGRERLAMGLLVPVGVDESWPLVDHALILTYQVVDRGAMGTARDTTHADESIEPRLGFVQAFAPGLRVGWGVGRSPFALSAGVDLVPALRTVGGTATTTMRAGIGLTVDLPKLILGRP